MVAARTRLLGAGVYAPILAELQGIVANLEPPAGLVLDAGCGPGYYLAGVLEELPDALGLGLDSSAHALRAAAGAHPRAAAVGCDLFGSLPVAHGSIDLVLNVFSPHNPAEFHRILRPDGHLLLARPTDGHLAQLRQEVEGMVGIDPDKEGRLERALGPHFETETTARTEYTARLTQQQAANLISMTPSARHLSAADLGRAAAGSLPSKVDVSVLTTVYRPRA